VKVQNLLAVIVVGAISAFPQGRPRPEVPPMHARQPHHFFPGAFPLFLGDYDYYPGYAPPAPSVVVLEQPPLYVLVPPPPSDPPKPEIHEYQQPATASASPTSDEAQAFAIVLKDGSVHSAVAVAVQAGAIYYVEPNGSHRLVSIELVNREATERLNRERKLRLQLPPAA
jgi:hypothetical protein